MTRMFDIREPSIEALKQAPIYFRYGSNKNKILVDALTAKALLAIYGALSSEANREKFARMLARPSQIEKLVSLAFKHVRL